MKINLGDRIIAYLALISGLTISSVAVWYSVAGLVSIFAAAAVPIIVMGVTLEISKLIATVWLKLNWKRAPIFIRTYLLVAIGILMVITSMGIFGFLSKAHSDQSLVSGDVQSKIAVYDEKIKTAKDNIDANRKALKQMDEAVDQSMARSTSETGADKAVAIRRSQQKERQRLQAEIAAEQKTISKLSEERAPIAAEVRKVEAEVGPIKYIAAFVYGDNPDANVLEKAVTWVIIIIVSVFDPLAVILLLASQYSFQWFRKAEEDAAQVPLESLPPEDDVDEKVVWGGIDHTRLSSDSDEEIDALDKINQELDAEVVADPAYELDDGPLTDDQVEQLKKSVEAFKTAEPVVEESTPEPVDEDIEELEQAPASEKEAMKKWKAENPHDSLKHQKKMMERGLISKLPWDDYLKAQPDVSDAEAAEEAAKWAMEQLERPGDYLTNPESTGYVQNSEQNKSTLWQKIHKP